MFYGIADSYLFDKAYGSDIVFKLYPCTQRIISGRYSSITELVNAIAPIEKSKAKTAIKHYKQLDETNKLQFKDHLNLYFSDKYIIQYKEYYDDWDGNIDIEIISKKKFNNEELEKYILLV